MRVGLVSNWGASACGVWNFGRDFAHALIEAGHEVHTATWDDENLPTFEKVVVNFDSGTQPLDKPIYPGSVVFVHHTYRGQPEGLDNAKLLLSPMKGTFHYFPYPIPPVAEARQVVPKTVGVTTLRHQGIDYLREACASRGYQLCLPDRWRNTAEEVARLASCSCLVAWYSDAPCRSLALATMIAAQRPILLPSGSRMFEYAEGSDEIYWRDYCHDPEVIADGLDEIFRDLETGESKVSVRLAQSWAWPVAIKSLESLW